MSKVQIVYIGPKERKRDTITGSRQVFPRLKPIEVTEEAAAILLRFENTFVHVDELDGKLKEHEEAEAKKAALEEELKKQAKLEAEQASFLVNIGGEDVDISKLAAAKIHTHIVAAGLDIKGQQSGESADDYRKRVRAELKE